ncbi:hypothetical protein HN832_02075 [archaeon]|jgi:hypothetical protein|nr:hypothetical protein [archaeon]MBT4373141.1 hypothetical protein [archaeon]MBT4531486.1 hypothetical protein [archaeon]MBT7001336.1 hypothetical protein [archaeon]MBT7282178.1 hypothetical protein [archaeon]
MNSAVLKDGSKIEIKIVDNLEMENILSNMKNSVNDPFSRCPTFVKFQYLGPRMIKERFTDDSNYFNEADLSPMEKQEDLTLENEKYDRSILALSGREIIGICALQWVKQGNNFWRYHTRFIDVVENKRNKRVGTHLIRELGTAPFIQNKIWEVGRFRLEGKKYIRHVIMRELKGSNIALVTKSHWGETPTKPGFYGRFE